MISAQGIKPDSKLVNKILDVKPPSGRKQLNCFLGLVNYFGRHIENFSEILTGFDDLRKGNGVFKWGAKHQVAFDELKQTLSKYPIVRAFDAK